MVYLDTAGHLVADSRAELHEFATRIGMRRQWFQDRPRLWHYDVTVDWRRRWALREGARLISPRETVEVLRRANEEPPLHRVTDEVRLG